MTPEKKDRIILDAGYNAGINDAIESLKYLQDGDVICDRLNRLKWKRRAENYEGKMTKYYHKGEDSGYIIFEDINRIIGIMVLIEENQRFLMSEKDTIFIKTTYKDCDIFKKEYVDPNEFQKDIDKELPNSAIIEEQ